MVASNPEIQFKHFMNYNDFRTIARMTNEEICSGANKEYRAAPSEEVCK
jgi:hypothetical protein